MELKEIVENHIQKHTESDTEVKKQIKELQKRTDAQAQHIDLQQLDTVAKLILNKLQHHIQTTATNHRDTMERISTLERRLPQEQRHFRQSQEAKTESEEGSSSTPRHTDEVPHWILPSWDEHPLPQNTPGNVDPEPTPPPRQKVAHAEQCPCCLETFLYFGEAMAHRCSKDTKDMEAEFEDLLTLRSQISADLLARTRKHLNSFKKLHSGAGDHTESNNIIETSTEMTQTYPKEETSESKPSDTMVRKRALPQRNNNNETIMVYEIPWGWNMVFDSESGIPYFWHKEVNDGIATWTPPWPDMQCVET